MRSLHYSRTYVAAKFCPLGDSEQRQRIAETAQPTVKELSNNSPKYQNGHCLLQKGVDESEEEFQSSKFRSGEMLSQNERNPGAT